MFAGIWAAIQLILRLFGLVDLIRDAFADYKRAQVEKKNQAQDKAVEDLKRATTEEEWNRANDEVNRNSPTSEP